MSQLFKNKISIHILLDFLEKINCQKMDNFYIVDITAYKRSIYINALKSFLSQLKEFYYPSKYHYIDPENINQNKFNTIVRQICNYTNTHYEKKIRHDQSRYSVIYRIYFSSNSNQNPTDSSPSVVNGD
jgi:hypothetical protein